MMHRTFAPLALAVVAMALALALGTSPAAAETFQSETLSEANVFPVPTGAPGTGSGQVVLNDAGTSAEVYLAFSGLGSEVIAWHIHCPAAEDETAVVVFDPGITKPTSPRVTWDASSSPDPVSAQVANLQAGLCYFNVHTLANLGGAIRGQITNTVGGVAELPEVAGAPLQTTASSGGNAGLLAGVIAAVVAGAVALGGAAWYVRRRWA
ncbi:MAG: CHRD domain-containing protein [Chloroflexi bacterium]|nr:CHRD domain-containing protein [Chloroflexota bacterium]